MSFIYNMADTWNAVGTTFAGILMNVSNGAGAVPVGAVTSQLVNVQTNGTQRFGVRMPHFVLGTDSSSFATFTDVWNTSGNPTGILYNTTNTASGSTSKLMDLQVGGTSQFAIDKAGVVTGLGSISVTTAGTGFNVKNATGAFTLGSSSDTIMTAPAAASLQHGAADVDTNASMVAQTIRVQGALTGGTTNQAGKDWTFIASPGKGTGVGGKILFQASKAGGSGATPNAAATVFTIDSVGAYGLFPAGTTLAAPLQFTSGTNMTTVGAGAVEFDGKVFYASAVSNSRQAVDSEQFIIQTANSSTYNNTGLDTNTAFQVFSTGSGLVTVQAATTYFFEGLYKISNTGTTSHTWATLFTLASSASVTDIRYTVLAKTGVTSAVTITAMSNLDIAVATQVPVTAASTSATEFVTIFLKGYMAINVGGTVSPAMQASSRPGASGTPGVIVLAGSYFRMWPVGTNTVANVGPWA